MSWQIYLTISIFLISCNSLLHRSLLKDENSSPQAQTIVFLGLGGIIAIVIALAQHKLNLFFSPLLIWNFLLLIVLLTPAFLLKYRAFQLIGASEVVMFSVTGRLWNVIGANLFLHEAITPKIVLGAILILCGAMLTRFEKKNFTINKGVILVLFSAIFFGFNDINDYFILQKFDSTNYLIYSYLLPVFALTFLQPQSLKKIRYYFRKDRAFKVLLLSLCDTLGMLSLYLAYQTGKNVAVIGPLRSTSIIITVVLAILFLKERNNIANKLIGSLVAVAGVILLL
ncbi:DMT family transporter [Candidatus Woesebacteria bacterium]|nr:MAG: DMT family transporter [Candidatus Woesebacteria bacterium]